MLLNPESTLLDSSGVPLWRKQDVSAFQQSEATSSSDLFKSNEPGMISLGAGAPSSSYFPFNEVEVKVSNSPGEASESTIHVGKDDFEPGVNEYSLDVALNYGQGTGSAQMLRFVTEHTELIHNPPYADWQCCLTVGSTSAWDSTLRIFCEKGDYILMEEYTFSTALETALPMGINAASIKMDDQGPIPSALDHLLSTWNNADNQRRHGGARKPFLLYTVPTGQNPTGATQLLERRRDIYRVAQKHDLIIVEDEPYYYLQLPAYHNTNQEVKVDNPRQLIPSYLSLDVDGRVLRLDSLSKVLAPGCRTGWVTASQQIIDKFVRQNEISAQNPSGFSQVIVYKLLNHHWGHTGFARWLEGIQSEYTWRRDTLLRACDEFLPGDIARWSPSQAGMFQWIEIDWKAHPLYKAGADHGTIQRAIFASAVQQKVFLTQGSFFWCDSSAPESRMFFRATYASASQENLTEAARRFGVALRNEFHWYD
ncbi:hypothetical protein UA08_07574 [Talaromyces atroroseus]|uniref:aromatic-amino-acid transaminase n=1 Tax=Talaromyces atroroseus TaxID=1441469 RepID=A0A225ARL0_TALAT|nr:hypothetical protein UA08_07574 [Talaromyces atroroseus]OKL57085.1 hypothetical protein UA08_07574 [Talaromyces atroroseus]